MKNKINNIITIFAIVAVVIAVINLSVTFFKVSDFKEQMTGFASGFVNLSIYSAVNINVTTSSIDWGNGAVATGANYSNLTTHGVGTGTVVGGNWTGSTGALADVDAIVIENIGNVNASIRLQSNLNANGLFGSATGSYEEYQWNISNKDFDACEWSGNSSAQNAFDDVSTTEITICNSLGFIDTIDEMFIDIYLKVPYDSANITKQLGSTITITADAAA